MTPGKRLAAMRMASLPHTVDLSDQSRKRIVKRKMLSLVTPQRGAQECLRARLRIPLEHAA